MKLEPLVDYEKPKYPVRSVVEQNPGILRNIPKRWRRKAGIGLLLTGVLLFSVTACRKNVQESTGTPYREGKVAPVFVHGDGIVLKQDVLSKDIQIKPSYQGKSGLMKLQFKSPPKARLVGNGPPWPSDFKTEEDLLGKDLPAAINDGFKNISEADAYRIIADEAKTAGLEFSHQFHSNDFEMSDNENTSDSSGDSESPPESIAGFQIDAKDKSKKIAYEFVSVFDAEENGLTPLVNTTFHGSKYDLLHASRELKVGLEKARPKEYTGIFYDPGSQYEENGRIISPDEALRLQVRDFIQWLKKEGVI